MIISPRRSVTRFFIPLIDVLILLFAIFLLMPFVSTSQPEESSNIDWVPVQTEPLPTDVKLLQDLLREERLRVARLEKERQAKLGDKLVVKVLEIDPSNGVLLYFDPDRHELRTEADAARYIARQKTLASQGGVVKDVFFLIRYPRGNPRFPTSAQEEQMMQWFKDVPYGFDR